MTPTYFHEDPGNPVPHELDARFEWSATCGCYAGDRIIVSRPGVERMTCGNGHALTRRVAISSILQVDHECFADPDSITAKFEPAAREFHRLCLTRLETSCGAVVVHWYNDTTNQWSVTLGAPAGSLGVIFNGAFVDDPKFHLGAFLFAEFQLHYGAS